MWWWLLFVGVEIVVVVVILVVLRFSPVCSLRSIPPFGLFISGHVIHTALFVESVFSVLLLACVNVAGCVLLLFFLPIY